MKKREQILRIRPFNMANFSSGSYMMFWVSLNVVYSLPAALLLWSGLAVSLKNEDGKLNYSILKERLDKIVLPICVIASILTAILCILSLSSFSALEVVFAIFASIIPLGVYFSIYLSARLLDKEDSLTKGKWFLLTLTFSVLMLLVGLFIVSAFG
ncbi:MAG: hypothetical protein FWG87_07345 [Defluviitaleaceae bacterium]|nr:hypothetical protein [Defluviitaleaceae bacterium]